MKNTSDIGQVIIEMTPQGGYVKVVAFHVASLIEVSLVGDPRQPESVLRNLALKKMRFVLEKKGLLGPSGQQGGEASSDPVRGKDKGRGWLV
ncbi:DUF6898 family protein [Kiloniella sp. b19]|uniref:DUF6898 family protein n=1 Tax=Kiloniella sp. GXU_MW_B19 TaxID=3141326 RepID=UPI0031CE1FD1